MISIRTVKELCEFIWYLEDKYNLLDFEIEGIKPWQAHRLEIYYGLGRYLGIFEKKLQRGMSKQEKLRSIFYLVKNSVIRNPFLNFRNVKYLVFSHPRSKIVNGETIDIYTHYLIEDLMNKQKSFIEFEEPFKGKHVRKFKSYKRYLDYIVLYRNLKAKFLSINISRTQLDFLKRIQKEIGISSFNLSKLLVDRVKKFIPAYQIYKRILEKISPEKIFLVVSYGRPELVKAAKDMGVKVIELQHGTFSKYHLGYSYPNKKNLSYFPDEFWVWNDYWANLIKFPENCKINIYPFKFLEIEKKKYSSLRKIKNQMVVLGQSVLTDKMAKKILDNYDRFKKFSIIFKLHPEEYGKINEYPNLLKLKKKANVKVVEDVNLYRLLAESDYQAGVFSTALYEGVEFGCKTILFNLPGIEYMDNFIKCYKLIIKSIIF
ncbi:hypothetical protein JCM12298_22240 [Desulfothermus naphthae]